MNPLERWPRRIWACALWVLVEVVGFAASTRLVQAADGPTGTPLNLVPLPAKIAVRPGTFVLQPRTRIVAPAKLRAMAEQLRDDLKRPTGLALPIVASAAAGSRSTPTIALALDARLTTLGDEGYRLTVAKHQVTVRAATAAGVFYGLQTLRQLFPAAIFRRVPTPEVAWEAPCAEIEDRPRFSWRGSHLDVGRHFMPKEVILKHLDLLALHKINVFHWHLTEHQGWRLEIKRYPKLTTVGAWRRDSPAGPTELRDAKGKRIWTFVGRPHGGYYTQDDVREVVRYAADRFITVVPEIEMPGHARAAIASYPELGNTGKPVEVGTTWGGFEDVFNVNDSTLTFVQNVLEEVLALFPSKFIHIGGDEVPKKEWKESAAAQARMKTLGLKNEDELQSWFVRQIDQWLTAKGRRLIGWDEILEGGLAPGATVMSWRGVKGGVAAAKAGHDVVIAPEQPTYFDHHQVSPETPLEPPAHRGLNTIESVYAWEPVPAELTAAEATHVLGAQAQLWTEYMPTPSQVEYQAWPRLCALSEVLWSPKADRAPPAFTAFRSRLVPHLDRLRILDVHYRPLEGPFPTLQRAPAASGP